MGVQIISRYQPFFMGLPVDGRPPMESYEVASQALDLLLGASGWSAWQENLAQCFAACPDGVFVSHIGAMLSRRASALRVNVKRLRLDTLATYLRQIGWPYETRDVETLMAELSTWTDHITICP